MKEILTSKRANLFYLEKCRVMVKNGVVVYLTEQKEEKQYWNIPIANTTVLLLGIGTSVTQAAVRLLSSASVLLGFCGNGATPLIAATEVEWLSPQSEYRPTEYLQDWLSFWFDNAKRLNIAKKIQIARVDFLSEVWGKSSILKENGFYFDDANLSQFIERFSSGISETKDSTELLLLEARLTKKLYQVASKNTGSKNFSRERESQDLVNVFLNHGNYLAYGLAATTLWTLGIPHGFAVMHGKTRRGALVFDIADLIKDAIVLPLAFISAKDNMNSEQFRHQCILSFAKHQALDFMFNTVKKLAQEGKKL